jgi:hypothetical protein
MKREGGERKKEGREEERRTKRDRDREAIEASEKFMAEVCKKCHIFLDWTLSQSPTPVAEQFWKNEMLMQASRKFGEFSQEELERLVERDWRCMPESERERVVRGVFATSCDTLEQQIEEQEVRLRSEMLEEWQ